MKSEMEMDGERQTRKEETPAEPVRKRGRSPRKPPLGRMAYEDRETGTAEGDRNQDGEKGTGNAACGDPSKPLPRRPSKEDLLADMGTRKLTEAERAKLLSRRPSKEDLLLDPNGEPWL